MSIDTAPKGRRVGAAILAATGLVWAGIALASLDRAFTGYGHSTILIVLLLLASPTVLLMLAAAALWTGARWAWAFAVVAVIAAIGLAGLVSYLLGSE
jgi:hypothetical protein